MIDVFDTYSQYYDLLYQEKDYKAEAKYVADLIRTHTLNGHHLLEMGCGTGVHAENLSRMGYDILGVDRSESMLKRAEARKKQLPDELSLKMNFVSGDIRSFNTSATFDVVLSLFHVLSY